MKNIILATLTIVCCVGSIAGVVLYTEANQGEWEAKKIELNKQFKANLVTYTHQYDFVDLIYIKSTNGDAVDPTLAALSSGAVGSLLSKNDKTSGALISSSIAYATSELINTLVERANSGWFLVVERDSIRYCYRIKKCLMDDLEEVTDNLPPQNVLENIGFTDRAYPTDLGQYYQLKKASISAGQKITILSFKELQPIDTIDLRQIFWPGETPPTF